MLDLSPTRFLNGAINNFSRRRSPTTQAAIREQSMTIWIGASSLIVAGGVTVSGLAVAQQPYPDLKGTWIGPGQFITQGKTDHWPNAGETEPVFRESSWTLVVDRQEGSRFVGSHGLTNGTR